MASEDEWVDELASPSSEMASTSTRLFSCAYRLHIPCRCLHETERNFSENCLASPTCLAGLQALLPIASVLDVCVDDMMGEGPELSHADNDDVASALTGSGTCGGGDDDDKTTTMTRPLPHKGIRNLGNTCYLNVILQLLFNIPRVRNAILSACGDVPSAEEEDDGGSGKGEEEREKGPEHAGDVHPAGLGLQTSGLGELFAEMALGLSGKGANARPFADFLSLNTTTQEDAQEFFVLLMNWLQGKGGCETLKTTFEGTLLYDRRCGKCHSSFKRAEVFCFLSLPMESTVEGALDAFLRPEEVEGFVCDACGLTATASSCQYLRTLPDVFVLHLNRFSFDLQMLCRKKVTDYVSFPLEWDLTPHLSQWKQREEVTISGDASFPSSSPAVDEALYSLVGIVNHFGDSAVSGHYTYHGKVDGGACWYNFDDAQVTKLQDCFQGTTRGFSKEAYMLVYQRRACKRRCDTDVINADVTTVDDERREDGTFAFPVLPPRLMKRVQSLNHELATARKAWEQQRARVASFLRQWGDIARELFCGNLLEGLGQAENEGSVHELEQVCALPSSWLRLFGRCFLPESVDVSRYNSGRRGTVDKGRDVVRFEGTAQSRLLHDMETLRCSHGKLAPWGPYKLVPISLAQRLASLLGSVGSLFSDAHCTEEGAACGSFVGWRLSEHICAECTNDMAAGVVRLKKSFDAEKQALAMLRESCNVSDVACRRGSDDHHRHCHEKKKNNNNNNAIIVDADEEQSKEESVFVSESVIEYWEASLRVNKKLKSVVSRQGFTGLFVVFSLTPRGGEDASGPSLSSVNTPLCDHHFLAPSSAVRVVPSALWRYLREQVVLPRCHVDNTSEYIEQVLPYLPSDTTTRCPECIQITVSTTTERHHARLAKLEEAKRFPTMVAAGQVLVASKTAETHAQHPNRSVWKRNLEHQYREHRRVWKKQQEAVIARAEKQLKTFKEEEKKREEHAMWKNMYAGRGKGRQNHKARGGSTATQTSQQCQQQLTPSSTVTSALQKAMKAVIEARLATCPELRHVYGCVPVWWVAQWWRWHTDVSGTVPLPSRLDCDAFRCSHGKTCLAPHVLNPADPFWETKSVSGQLAQMWSRRVAAAGDTGVADVISFDDDSASKLLPPLFLVPIKEFIDILEVYGQSDALFPATPDTAEDAARRVNTRKVLLFEERNTERVFDPPSCDVCVTALLNEAKQSSLYFVNGSLNLQLHLRRSKKHFYDAKDVLEGVHYTTTLREVRAAILRLVKKKHGFVLPPGEMKLLCGRKPLQRDPARTKEWKELKPLPPVPATAPASAFDVRVVAHNQDVADADEVRGHSDSNNNNDSSNDTNNHRHNDKYAGVDVATGGAPSFSPLSPSSSLSSSSSSLLVGQDGDECTLFECGVLDGCVLTVNATERVLLPAAAREAKGGKCGDVWEDASAVLQQTARESLHAFASTRLCGSVEGRRHDGGKEAASPQIACRVCTFVNPPGRICCEVCEALLGQRP